MIKVIQNIVIYRNCFVVCQLPLLAIDVRSSYYPLTESLLCCSLSLCPYGKLVVPASRLRLFLDAACPALRQRLQTFALCCSAKKRITCRHGTDRAHLTVSRLQLLQFQGRAVLYRGARTEGLLRRLTDPVPPTKKPTTEIETSAQPAL